MIKRFLALVLAVLVCVICTSACSKQSESQPESQLKSVDEIMAGMTLRQKIGQLFIVRPDALDFNLTQEQIDDSGEKGVLELTEEMRTALEEYPVGGVAMFGKNIENPGQLKKFTADLKTAGDIPLFLAVDEEGGGVARLANSEALTCRNTQERLKQRTPEKWDEQSALI